MALIAGEAAELQTGEKVVVADDQGRWAAAVVTAGGDEAHLSIKWTRFKRDPPVLVPYQEATARLCKCSTPEEAIKQALAVKKGEKQGWVRENAPAPARVGAGMGSNLAAMLARASGAMEEDAAEATPKHAPKAKEVCTKVKKEAPVVEVKKEEAPVPEGRRSGRARKETDAFVPGGSANVASASPQ